MYNYEHPTREDRNKIQKLLKGNKEPLADLVLFSGGLVIDRVLVEQKPFNVVNGLKKVYEKRHPSWKNLLRVITARKKKHLNLKY